MRGAAQRLGQLIDDLLVLSRTSRAEIRPQPLDLAEIARSIARELADGDGARDVQFRVSDELNAHADPGLARVLLQNLLQNAWKFTSHHQRALIEVGAQELDGERVFFVRDDGAGFDMQFVGKLFGAFQRLHSENEFSGDGIGLATAQRIVRRHSGRIWAEGALEGGATVYFTLPDSTNRQEEAAA